MANLLSLATKALRIYDMGDSDYLTKKAFHAAARSELKKLAKSLNIPAKVHSNLAGDAVLGESILHSDKLYIQIMHMNGEITVLYRSCNGLKDFTGGPNQYMRLESFLDPSTAIEVFNKFR